MKILLTAINSKYIHSNLAVYALKAYALKQATPEDVEIEIAEYTINQQLDHIMMDIYERKPDVLCLSCYIWNLSYVERLTEEIKKLRRDMPIWVGGPEVSYDSTDVLKRLPSVTGVMKGEGEETFAELTRLYEEKRADERSLAGIKGITFRKDNGEIAENEWRMPMDLSKVPFVYEDMAEFEHKIIYYETSRGCPFSCSYCLSSVDKKLRFRDIELVKKELQFFLDHRVPQVKFVDRTFNCNHQHAIAIWNYLLEHDNGVTNFHFEISADLLNEEELRLMKQMRPGLIQLEIGVQSVNPKTLAAIRRSMKSTPTRCPASRRAAHGSPGVVFMWSLYASAMKNTSGRRTREREIAHFQKAMGIIWAMSHLKPPMPRLCQKERLSSMMRHVLGTCCLGLVHPGNRRRAGRPAIKL